MKAAKLTPVNTTELFYCQINNDVTNGLLLNEQTAAARPLRHALHMQSTRFVFQYLWALLLKSTPVGGVKIWYEGMIFCVNADEKKYKRIVKTN